MQLFFVLIGVLAVATELKPYTGTVHLSIEFGDDILAGIVRSEFTRYLICGPSIASHNNRISNNTNRYQLVIGSQTYCRYLQTVGRLDNSTFDSNGFIILRTKEMVVTNPALEFDVGANKICIHTDIIGYIRK